MFLEEWPTTTSSLVSVPISTTAPPLTQTHSRCACGRPRGPLNEEVEMQVFSNARANNKQAIALTD